jgi:membrane protease YdiL (CAAX protease family)
MNNDAKATYKDFLNFLKKPEDKQDTVQTLGRRTTRLILLLVPDVLLSIAMIILVNQLAQLGWVNRDSNKLEALFQSIPIGRFLLLAIFIIPFFEELIFRYYLRFNPNILIRFVVWLSSLTGKGNGKKVKDKLNKFWIKGYFFIFYFSALIFSLAHVTNYDSSAAAFYLFPILVLPQFFTGIFIGYLRVRYNLLLGYCMHALHNAVFIIIPLLFLGKTVEKLNLKTDTYTLKIEELNYGKGNASATIGPDSISFKSMDLKSVIASLTGTEKALIETNNSKQLEVAVNLQFVPASKLENPADKRIILNNVCKVYGFTLEQKSKKQEVFELSITDSAKLMKNLSASGSNTGTTTITSKEIILKNVPLTELAGVISENYNVYIISDSLNANRVNFILPKKSFLDLKMTLKTDYGINLFLTRKDINYSYIKFEKQASLENADRQDFD